MKNAFNLTICFMSLFLASCSTLTGSGSMQPVSVRTFDSKGKELEGVKCELTNDCGAWFITTPGSVIITRSNKDLYIVCKKEGLEIGIGTIVSKTKVNMWGNIILGGCIGALVDHHNGSAYEYPSDVKIFMGQPLKTLL